MMLLVLAAAASVATESGHWSYREIKDPITDVTRGIAALDGPGGSVVVKCDKNGPDTIYVEVISNKFLGGGRDALRNVASRIDGGEVKYSRFFYDKESAMLFDNAEAAETARAWAKAKRLVIRLTTFEGETVDLDIPSDGDASAVDHAFQTCGQK